jgi:hypothetical protein
MRKLLTLSSLALCAATLFAAPAFAQDEAAGEVVVSSTPRGGWPIPDDAITLVSLAAQTPSDGEALSPGVEDEIIIACLRLPTLADLSKERWNDVHRRYPGRRGQPIRRS